MKRLLLSTVALLALAGAAQAAPIDWNFQDHPGLLGNSQGFTAGGLTLTARGFTLGDVGTALFVKNAGGDETGLGLNNDPSGNTEISFGHGFVQLNLDGIRAQLLTNGFSFQMGSTTQGEGWKVYGSEDSSPFTFTLLASSSGTNDEGFHSLAGGYDNYNFFYSGGGPGVAYGGCGDGCNANVLLTNFDAVQAVPELSTWAMMGLGFIGVGLLGLRKRRHSYGQPFRFV